MFKGSEGLVILHDAVRPNSTINKFNSINLIFMIIFGLLLMVAAVPKEFFNANDCYDEILVIVTERTQQDGLD